MPAIITRFAGPTNHRGARVIATCNGQRVITMWEHKLDPFANHQAAARALTRRRWGHQPGLASGQVKAGTYAHVVIL